MNTTSKNDNALVPHNIDDIISIFNRCFKEDYQTILVRGDEEPIYLPADDTHPLHRIIFANNFYASALHEISHWLVAGQERRQQIDFGYWYCPDGRDKATQAKFETVEIAPQSYEWMLCVAAGFPFQVSCDNLNGDFEPDHRAFKALVHNKVLERLQQPYSKRFNTLLNALHDFYGTLPLSSNSFALS